MDIRQLRENRSAFPATELVKYRGQWVALSGDGRRVVASAPDLVELDALLGTMGEDPEQVALEFIDVDESFVTGPNPRVLVKLPDGRQGITHKSNTEPVQGAA